LTGPPIMAPTRKTPQSRTKRLHAETPAAAQPAKPAKAAGRARTARTAHPLERTPKGPSRGQ
jgi:hypothetical protein